MATGFWQPWNCQRIDKLAWLYCESITNTISPVQGNPDLYYNITTSVTIIQYYELLKIESLDNAILELWLAKPSWCMSHYTMLSKYGNCTRLLKKTSWKSVVLTNNVWKNSRYFVGVLNETIMPLAFVGYEMIIANSYPSRTRGIIRDFKIWDATTSRTPWLIKDWTSRTPSFAREK